MEGSSTLTCSLNTSILMVSTRGHVNIEVVTDNYRAAEIVAKAEAGFQMHGASQGASKLIENAVAGLFKSGGGGGGGGGGKGRSKGIMEW